MGGQVYAGGGEDTVVRTYEKSVQPETPGQLAAQGRFTRGSQGWGLLTDGQRADWTRAAKSVLSKDKRRLKPKPISGSNLYLALSAKWLQMHGTGSVPQDAPSGRFGGDRPTFAVTHDLGAITITASEANAAGVTTEIFLQKLDAAYLKPKGKIQHATFCSFGQGGQNLVRVLPVAYGAYAVAVQFVNVATGQTAGYQDLGTQVMLAAVEGGLQDSARLRKAA